jgi:hypothetical protein
MRDGDERLGRGVDLGRPLPPDRLPEPIRDQLRGEVGERDLEEQPGTSPPNGEHGRDHEPDEALPPDPREPFEDRG